MARTVGIANNKGGVGKSQVTVHLADALARAGNTVLVVDLDPQANATRRLGVTIDPAQPIPTMSEVLKSGERGVGEGAVVPCGWVDGTGAPLPSAENIDLLPARFDLINRESESGQVGAVRRLKKSLDGWAEDYDVVLIDTPPNLGHLTQMAMAAADAILIPTDPAYDSAEAAIRVRDFATVHAEDLGNPGLYVAGVIITRYRKTLEAEEQIKGLSENFGDLLWNPGKVARTSKGEEILVPRWIPERIRYGEADSAATSLTAWNDFDSREAAAVYDSLATIFQARINGGGAS